MPINDWMQGDGTDALSGTTAAYLIDDNIKNYIQDPINVLLSNYQQGCGFRIASNTTVAIDAGEVVCSNSAETARRFRKNSASVTLDISVSGVGGLDTGSVAANTVYYVYVTADTSNTAFSGILSTSSTSPSGVTYFKKIGYVKTNASSNITTKGSYFSSGAIAQTVYNEVIGDKTYTIVTNIPDDNTKPQSGEGIEMTDFATSIIPTTANSIIEIELAINIQASDALGQGRKIYIFKDSDADSIGGLSWYGGYGYGTSGHTVQDTTLNLRKRVQLTSASETTFKFRVGHFNGTSVKVNVSGPSGYNYGGVIVSSVKITEYRG